MKKNWNQILESAQPVVDFLSSDSFFSRPYDGDRERFIVTASPEEARYLLGDEWDEWEEIIDAQQFPDSDDFDWHYLIGAKLINTNCLGALDKNLHGADRKLTIEGVVNFLEETMPYYMKILLNCYANNYMPEIWKDILYVFQHNGFPCGWKGDYPEGKMIVFSNE
jgi:conserved hypothetical protein